MSVDLKDAARFFAGSIEACVLDPGQTQTLQSLLALAINHQPQNELDVRLLTALNALSFCQTSKFDTKTTLSCVCNAVSGVNSQPAATNL